MTQVSDNGFAVTMLAHPGRPTALVCLAGDIDMEATTALSDVVERLSIVAPGQVIIDLAEVAFAGAALPNFLALLHQALGGTTALTVCRATSRVRRLLELTAMDAIATLRLDLPTLRGLPVSREPSTP